MDKRTEYEIKRLREEFLLAGYNIYDTEARVNYILYGLSDEKKGTVKKDKRSSK